MKVAILYSNYLDEASLNRKIGGIETYIYNLALLCKDLGYNPIIYQWSRSPFKVEADGITVEGVPILNVKYKKRPKALYDYASKHINQNIDLMIFGSDQQAVKSNHARTISIQHGIAWDLPSRFLTSKRLFHQGILGAVYKIWVQRRFVRLFDRCHNRVCVDYNFINWYRTQIPKESKKNTWVIPNFAKIATSEQINNKREKTGPISILFARRFQEFRGTRIFAESAKSILKQYSNVSFTFAGEGPDEDWLKALFKDEERVSFIKYSPEDSLQIHLEHDIAVIPSLASEGTSLSVAEAMGAGCAVIATNVGGITNMIIDGYNGRLVEPNTQALIETFKYLIESPLLLKILGINGYKTASEGFSKLKWQTQWKRIIDEFL